MFTVAALTALVVVLCCGLARFAEPSMAFPADDWESASAESQGLDAAGLESAMSLLDRLTPPRGAKEALVIRNGRVVWSGPETDEKHNIWSATKCISSTILGLLVQDGGCALETKAREFVPELAELYPDVTLRHFATMTSGYDGDGGTYGRDDPLDGGLTPLTPATPLFSPGTRFSYFDDAMRQFGNVMTRIVGQPLEGLFRSRIADPIGMRDWSWPTLGGASGPWWTPGQPDYAHPACDDTSPGRVNDAAGGFATSARQYARFGHLFLNRGRWRGTPLVSAGWVAQATRVQVPVSTPLNPISARQRRTDGRGVYGLNWWVNGRKPGGDLKWPDAPPDTFSASGLNINKCFVIPSWNMVIVRMAAQSFVPEDQIDRVWGEFFAKLTEAVIR